MKFMTVSQILDGHAYDSESKQHYPKYTYQVEKLINSIEPAIRTRLTGDEVTDYCEDEDWKVTVT